ncbi:MAG: hypothetical protein NZ873_02705 [Crenarchaeota archaeon]|nr:hypothetical protein [Thermoproteota archaeon]MDW8033974.1 hypothetical protein [Nitrososphaerota archaeon]
MANKIMLPLTKEFRKWLLAGSLASIATGFFFIFLLISPLVVFEGEFLNGSVAVTWYRLVNYGEPVHHPGLDSIPLLTIPVFTAVFFSMSIGLLTIFKSSRSREVSHVVPELLVASLEVYMIFTGVFFSLRLNVMHALAVLPTQVGGMGSAGLLVVPGSIRSETFTSILIKQFYPIASLSILLIALAAIIGYETVRVLETLSKGPDEDTSM